MAATCDMCGAPLGLMRFRYAEGAVCKRCYELASAGCTTTIRQMTRAEVERAYAERREALEGIGEFRATQRVGDFLLIDEERRLICLPNNRRATGVPGTPEIVPWKAVRSVSLATDPARSADELRSLSKDDPDAVVGRLAIEIRVDRADPYTITFFATPVRAKSFAYRQSLGMAMRSLELLEQIAPRSGRPRAAKR